MMPSALWGSLPGPIPLRIRKTSMSYHFPRSNIGMQLFIANSPFHLFFTLPGLIRHINYPCLSRVVEKVL